MIERIEKQEEKLDKILLCISDLNNALDSFENNQKNLNLVNKYYGSKNWFKDKEMYEKNFLPKVKAGVLAEDTVWNMNEDIKELLNRMQRIVNKYSKVKK